MSVETKLLSPEEKAVLDACAVPTPEQIEQMETGIGAIFTPARALELGMKTAIGNVKRALAAATDPARHVVCDLPMYRTLKAASLGLFFCPRWPWLRLATCRDEQDFLKTKFSALPRVGIYISFYELEGRGNGADNGKEDLTGE